MTAIGGDEPGRPIGRRIVVFGQSGSGKTTFARRIGAALGVPHIELDALFHRPNWQETPDDEFRAIVGERLAAAGDGWVVDGNYRRVRDIVLSQAETVVWLRLPFRVVYPRLLRRTITRSWRKEELWNGNRESFRLSFASRESILLWGITNWRPHVRKMKRALEETPHNANVIVVRSQREVDALLAEIEQAAEQSTVSPA
jgi:adenylate kinase family enzyme